MKISITSETSEKIKECFFKKLNSFKKENSKYLKENKLSIDNIFILFNSKNYIEYKFRDSFYKLDTIFQKETELFFSEALKGCLDKYSE